MAPRLWRRHRALHSRRNQRAAVMALTGGLGELCFISDPFTALGPMRSSDGFFAVSAYITATIRNV